MPAKVEVERTQTVENLWVAEVVREDLIVQVLRGDHVLRHTVPDVQGLG